MSNRTPRMDNNQLKDYLSEHLKNELEWVLRAAAMWHVQRAQRPLRPELYLHVYAMDSCFLHARALFEFFTKKRKDNREYNHYLCDQYLGKGKTIESPLYDKWADPLHSFLIHAQDRSKPNKLLSFDRRCEKPLKDMPIDFAREIVRLWREFQVLLGSGETPEICALQRDAEAILNKAISSTFPIYKRKTIVQSEVKPIDW